MIDFEVFATVSLVLSASLALHMALSFISFLIDSFKSINASTLSRPPRR